MLSDQISFAQKPGECDSTGIQCLQLNKNETTTGISACSLTKMKQADSLERRSLRIYPQLDYTTDIHKYVKVHFDIDIIYNNTL